MQTEGVLPAARRRDVRHHVAYGHAVRPKYGTILLLQLSLRLDIVVHATHNGNESSRYKGLIEYDHHFTSMHEGHYNLRYQVRVS